MLENCENHQDLLLFRYAIKFVYKYMCLISSARLFFVEGFWFPDTSNKSGVRRAKLRFSSRLAVLWERVLITTALAVLLNMLKQIILDGFFRKFFQLGAVVLTFTFYATSIARTMCLALNRRRLVRLFGYINSILNHRSFRYFNLFEKTLKMKSFFYYISESIKKIYLKKLVPKQKGN